ncbi:Hypothetical predicted protein [Paramuricea clavata]|uniref:Uncharacterized protein n=1 Tax=Paramuricea clavata TaxID=317549 RepID=A0A6S7GGB4_PARCT|nr:Hypothetical predicted protein [Paramuricea clavata]
MVRGSTSTFYFETYVNEEKLLQILQCFLKSGSLSYYRYLSYVLTRINGKDCVKIIGVLQFVKRSSTRTVRALFESGDVYIDTIQPSQKPNVLSFMKMYVLGSRHRVEWSETKWSKTSFSFGGRKIFNKEFEKMEPYIKTLEFSRKYDKDDFPYDLPGARIICKFKAHLDRCIMNI